MASYITEITNCSYTVTIRGRKLSGTQCQLSWGINDPSMPNNSNTLSTTCGPEGTLNVSGGTTIYFMGNDGSTPPGGWLATLPSYTACPSTGLYCPPSVGGNPPSFSFVITGDTTLYFSVDGDTPC